MKKVLILLFIVMLCSVNVFCFSGCACAHNNLTEISDTSTCVEAGIITYQCDDCGQTIAKPGKKGKHDYSVKVSTDPSNCSVVYKCKYCDSNYTDKAANHTSSISGTYCTHCNGNFKELTIRLIKQTGTFISQKNVYELKNVGTTHTTILQYDVKNDMIWIIDVDQSSSNGLAAMGLLSNSVLWIGMMFKSEFYYSDSANYTNWIQGTINYTDLRYSNRTFALSVSNYSLPSSLVTSYSKVVHEMMWRGAITTTTMLFGTMLDVGKLGFTNIEK